MKEEFCLSDKIEKIREWYGVDAVENHDIYELRLEDVKEFIQRLKNSLNMPPYYVHPVYGVALLRVEDFIRKIDTLAGAKLVEK